MTTPRTKGGDLRGAVGPWEAGQVTLAPPAPNSSDAADDNEQTARRMADGRTLALARSPPFSRAVNSPHAVYLASSAAARCPAASPPRRAARPNAVKVRRLFVNAEARDLCRAGPPRRQRAAPTCVTAALHSCRLHDRTVSSVAGWPLSPARVHRVRAKGERKHALFRAPRRCRTRPFGS